MPDEPEIVEAKGESLVKHCPLCGVAFRETVVTNNWLRCNSCYSDHDREFQVKVRTGENT